MDRSTTLPFRLERALIMAIILLGAALRLQGLATDSLWFDEIGQVLVASENSFAAFLQGVEQHRGAAPLDYLILRVVLLIGRQDFIVRIPAAFAGISAIAVTYCLGRYLFGDVEGLVAAFLLAISPFHLYYSQEARPYALLVLLSMLSLYCFLRALDDTTYRWWTSLTICTLLGLYDHYYAGFMILLEGMLVLTKIITGTNRSSADRVAVRFVVAIGIVSLLFAPWALIAGPSERGIPQWSGWARPPVALQSLLAAFSGDIKTSQRHLPAKALFLLLFFVGWISGSVLERTRGVVVIIPAWMLLAGSLVVAIDFWRTYFFAPRQLIFVYPLFLLLVSRGIRAIGSGIEAGWLRICSLFQVHNLGVTMIVAVCMVVSWSSLSRARPLQKEDWRGTANYLQKQLQEGDVVLCDGVFYKKGGDAYRALRGISYYLQRESTNGYILTADSDLDLSDLRNTQEGQQVWGVLYRGSAKLDKTSVEAMSEIIDFRDVSVVRLRNPSSNLLENMGKMIDVLILVQPFSEARFDLYLLKAKLEIQQGFLISAQQVLEQAREVRPSDSGSLAALGSIYIELGNALRENGQYEEAILRLQDALRLSPASTSASLNLGLTYMQLGIMEEALPYLEESVSKQPGSYWAHHLLGSWYRRNGMYDEALSEYQRALSINPQLPELYYLIALVYEQQGRQEEAVGTLERYLAVAPEGQFAIEAKDKLLHLRGRE